MLTRCAVLKIWDALHDTNFINRSDFLSNWIIFVRTQQRPIGGIATATVRYIDNAE